MNKRQELVTIGEKFQLLEKPIPEPPEGGYIVKTLYAGVCHSDVHLSTRISKKYYELPVVLGHEISGTIHAVGKAAAKERPDLTVGSKVIVYPWSNCSRCLDCTGGRNPYCRGVPPLYTTGIFTDGGYQEYVAVHLTSDVLPVADDVDLAVGALSACSGLTSYSAVLKITGAVEENLRIRGEALILLVGAGGVGYWAVEICHHIWGANEKVRICVVDVLQEKLDDAKAAGADIIHKWDREDSDEDIAAKLKDVCGAGFDAAIDFTGMTSSSRRIFHSLNTCATWVIVGLFGGTMPDISQVALTYSGIKVQGSVVGNREEMAEVMKLVAEKKIKGPPIEYIKLEDVYETLQKVATGEQRGRAVVKF